LRDLSCHILISFSEIFVPSWVHVSARDLRSWVSEASAPGHGGSFNSSSRAGNFSLGIVLGALPDRRGICDRTNFDD